MSTSLSASVLRPTIQVILGFSLRVCGIECLFIKGMFAVLNPLLAKYIDVGVLLVLLTPNKIIKEVDEAKNTFRKYKWPTIDVTRKSVEETAASIIKIYEIYKENG